MQQLRVFTFSFISLALMVYILSAASKFFIPLLIALVITYLLIAIAEGIYKLPLGKFRIPKWGAFLVAFGFFLLGIWVIIQIVGANITSLLEAAPGYQQKLNSLSNRFFDFIEVTPPNLADQFKEFNIVSLVGNVVLMMTEVAGYAGVIGIYVIFMLIEYQFFDDKLDAFLKSEGSRSSARKVLGKINDQVQSYVWLKTLLSLLTALCSYLVLAFVGVDFAPFWAMLIFLLNYIPTFGSIIATAFPCLLALIQFGELLPFLEVTLPLISIQFVIGNILEPRLVGSRFNLSGLVILLSLAIWGQIWGIIGMFLCVPIIMILSIVLSNFPQTRPIAILLSQDGKIAS